MGQPTYTSAMFLIIINGTVLLSLINSTIAYDLILTDNNVFNIYNGTNEHYMGNCLYNKGNYTKSTPFHSTLTKLFSNLTSSSSTKTFSNFTSGSGQDTVHAWFYCSDPDNQDLCSSCVRNSTRVLLDICPTKTAIVYSNIDCQVWYTNATIFPEDDTTSFSYASSTTPNMPDPIALNRTVVGSMLRLIDRVMANSSSDSEREYVDGLYVGQKVFTFVECLPGVSKMQCKDCLLRGLNETMVNCLSFGSAWAIDFRSSCQMRYSCIVGNSTSLGPASSPLSNSSSMIGSSPSSSSYSFGKQRWLVSTLGFIVATILL